MYCAESASVSPTTMPPTIAPAVESSPPRMAAGNAISAIACVPRPSPAPEKSWVAMNSTATPASAPATSQAVAVTRALRIPISAAASRFSAWARIATPQFEYRKARKNSAISTAPTTSATAWVRNTVSPASRIGCAS